MFEKKQPVIKAADLVAGFAAEKSGENIVIMDMSRVSGICDFFVVCSASSVVRAKTIAENVELKMKQEGHRVFHREGLKEGKWVLLDFGEIVLHIFQDETRKRYNLEDLWGDAPRRAYITEPDRRDS